MFNIKLQQSILVEVRGLDLAQDEVLELCGALEYEVFIVILLPTLVIHDLRGGRVH